MNAPIIYVCTPFANKGGEPTKDANVEFAIGVCLSITLAGGVPYAPHLLFPRFLHDENSLEREMGIACGLRMMEKCAEELWAVLPPWRDHHSAGMEAEMGAAIKLGLPVYTARGYRGMDPLLNRLRSKA